MSLSILNNVASLIAQGNLSQTSDALNTSLQRLSSGLKINTGADGPAAFVISQEQQAQIAGLQTAIDNTNQAVNVAQTAGGALNEINNLLVQIRGLALSSANTGVNDTTALNANQAEINNALSTIDSIATSTQFGTKQLLNGSAGYNATSVNAAFTSLNATSATTTGNYTISTTGVGDQNAQKGAITVNPAVNGNLSNTVNLSAAETLVITGVSGTQTVTLAQGLTNTQVAAAINAVSSQTGVLANINGPNGGLQLVSQQFGQNFSVASNVLQTVAGSTGLGIAAGAPVNTSSTGSAGDLTVQIGQNAIVSVTPPGGVAANVTASGATVSITSGAGSGLSFTLTPAVGNSLVTQSVTGGIITVSNGTLTFQIGANAGQTAQLTLNKVTADALGLNVPSDQFSNLSQINVTTSQGAQDSIKVIDQAISDISTLSGTIGAFQNNTLQATATNLQTILQNTTAANSTIRDTNYAQQIAAFTQQQVQLQAGTSVLTSANQIPQIILTLLKG